MFVIIGIIVVFGGVLGGFMIEGGEPAVLLQYAEFIIIGGASIGSLLISTPPRLLKQLMGKISSVFKSDAYTKAEFLNLLKTLFDLFNFARKEGLLGLESHVDAPEKSSILSKNAFLIKDHHACNYLCDALKLLLAGGISPFDLEMILEADIETHHDENAIAPSLVQKIGDALPGIGIVAAVLGIVITMKAIDGPPEEIGEKVGAALVGTFLGILLSYGLLQPIATRIELTSQAESRYVLCIKAAIIGFAKGSSPSLVVEFARRVIFGDVRPSFKELEQSLRGGAKAGK
jgi:chemotaxis protein MotA